MNQTVDRRLELYECAKRSDAYYLARYLFPYDILLSRQIPGLGLELLITEGNFLLLGVYVQNLNFDLLILRENVARVLDAYPAYICNMQQTVYAAYIYKRAEICETFNRAFDNRALLEGFKNLLLALLSLLFQHFFVRKYKALLTLVCVYNLHVQCLTYENAKIFHILERKLRSGYECVIAFELSKHAAFYNLLYFYLENLLLVEVLKQRLPLHLAFDLSSGKTNIAFAVVQRNDFSLNLIACLKHLSGRNIAVRCEILLTKDTVGLVANVYTNLVVRYLNHYAFYELASSDSYKGLLQLRKKVFAFVGGFSRSLCRRSSIICRCIRCSSSSLLWFFGGFGCSLRRLLSRHLGLSRFGYFFSNLHIFEFAHSCLYLPNYPIRC